MALYALLSLMLMMISGSVIKNKLNIIIKSFDNHNSTKKSNFKYDKFCLKIIS